MMEEKIVVFLDILGFKELINKMVSDKKLKDKIINVLKFTKIQADENDLKKKRKEFREKFKYKVEDIPDIKYEITTFSDSIVISSKIENFQSLFIKVFEIVRELFLNGFLCRGGCSVGELYHENGIVFGEGLVNSYEIESSLSKYPRVIITGKVKEIIDAEWQIKLTNSKQNAVFKNAMISLNKYSIFKNIFEDMDGLAFLNPFPTKLNYFEKIDQYKSEKDILLGYSNVLLEKYSELDTIKNVHEMNIHSKLKWLAKKYNEIVVVKWNEEHEDKLDMVNL
jgi:hypothetical protein